MQRNRLKRITLRLHRADNDHVPIAQSLKLTNTRLGLLGWDAGQKSAGGLRVEQQGVFEALTEDLQMQGELD